MTKKQDYLKGARAGLPVLFGFIPVGIAYAIMARQAGFSIFETVGMSIFVFAGASQMMAVGMYAKGAGLLAMIVATFIINLRHLIMSTCVVNRIRGEKPLPKLLAAFGITDESFAIFTASGESYGIWYFFGLITVTYASWIAGSFIGALTSQFLPDILSKSFAIALYALFLALLVPKLHGNLRLMLLIIFTAMLNSVLSLFLDSSWALIISTLASAAIGVFFVDLEGDGNDK